jgi:3-methyladenine DNA glycosylase AlkD
MTPAAADLTTRLDAALTAAANPDRATAMRAYMRDQFPFLGITAPQVKALAGAAARGWGPPTEADLGAVAQWCWARDPREYQYAACGLLRRYAGVCGPGFLDTARQLIITKSWWDTVDALAAHLVGPLVRREPALVGVMDAWIVDDNIWLVRTALLHQLMYKGDTDAERLFEYCRTQAEHPDFFIRKAIGWALRQYAWTAPEPVRAFVATHMLSPLSQREALKNLR